MAAIFCFAALVAYLFGKRRRSSLENLLLLFSLGGLLADVLFTLNFYGVV